MTLTYLFPFTLKTKFVKSVNLSTTILLSFPFLSKKMRWRNYIQKVTLFEGSYTYKLIKYVVVLQPRDHRERERKERWRDRKRERDIERDIEIER